MKCLISAKDVEDGKKIAELFEKLDETDKSMVAGYLSALADRSEREQERQAIEV